MNRLKLLATTALTALTLAACDEGTPPLVEPPPPPVPVGTISGSVTIDGMAVSGVAVALSAGATTTTGSGGNFAFSGVEAGNYAVVISGFPEDAAFAQAMHLVTITTAAENVQVSFAGHYIRSSAVIGNVVAVDAPTNGSDGQAETLSGVEVTLSGAHAMGEIATTTMSGGFAFDRLRAGSYTVTISDFPEDISFDAVSVRIEVGVGEVASADFTGTFTGNRTTPATEGRAAVDGRGSGA